MIAGPTAVGKSDLALAVARQLGGEVVSADSAMVYRGLNIGTAKPGPVERSMVPHHLLDVADPAERFSMAQYRALAVPALADISARGRVPIIVGGTGLYIRSLLRGDALPAVPPDEQFRREMEEVAAREGPGALHERLRAVDPEAAAVVHPRNLRRIVRALEVYAHTGRPISEAWEQGKGQAQPQSACFLVCNRPRDVLKTRIASRVDSMLAEGLIAEVAALQKAGVPSAAQSMQALGYKETLRFLAGEIDREDLRQVLQTATWQYAKRQLTWFRREPDAIWLDLGVASASGALPLVRERWRECQGGGGGASP